MISYDDFNRMPTENSSANFQTQPNKMNNFAADYLNTVKENRSMYGNYVDNSLAYDPHKEQKSIMNVIYQTDNYNPWGKPGGGAPALNKNGELSTKIAGTLKWNLNGETDLDRVKRLANSQKANKNTLLYLKNPPSPNLGPRLGNPEVRQATTYNYNYRDHYSAATYNPSQRAFNGANAQAESASLSHLPMIQSNIQASNHGSALDMTPIEREASMRNQERQAKGNAPFKSSSWTGSYSGNENVRAFPNRTSHAELNRVSNKLYNDNQPTNDYPNDPFWFGRAGPHRTVIPDARRHKLLDSLENYNSQNSARM